MGPPYAERMWPCRITSTWPAPLVLTFGYVPTLQKCGVVSPEQFEAAGIDPQDRPERLSVEDWGRLTSGLGGDNEKLSYAILRRGINWAARDE